MAVPANTYTTYDSAGEREDLIDVITNIAPEDTWCLSNFGTTKASNRYHEWLTDTLDPPTANKVAEGDDATAAAITPPTRTGNYCQVLRKVFQISDTEEAVNHAGRTSEIAYQTTLKMKSLARDIEYAILVNTGSASGASGTAREMNGLVGFITTNVTTGATGTGSSALTETMLTDNLQLVWAQGGTPSNLICGAFQKRKIDAFTTNTRNVDASGKKLIAAVDVYQSSFGTVACRLSTIMNTSLAGYVFVIGDLNLWKKAWLRPIKKVELAKTGSSTKWMIEAELTLESRQEAGSGKIYNLTTS
jgi:hypothetical protein